jgi:pimeloyl-ACP methyl ester carboxylesterase
MEDVVGFVQAMKFEKPILMGHSMGAATVMRIGAVHPDLARAIIMLDPGLGRFGPGAPGRPGTGAPPAQGAPSAAGSRPAPTSWSLAMFGSPESLVAQNDMSFDELDSICRKQNTKWDPVDCKYWALSKKQYHGPYTQAQSQAMTGTMSTADALSKITAPALILKADAPPDVRKANEQAASVMQHGKLVHIDGAAHNLHHDQRKSTVQELTVFLNTL